MKKVILFAMSALLFTACEKAPVVLGTFKELSPEKTKEISEKITVEPVTPVVSLVPCNEFCPTPAGTSVRLVDIVNNRQVIDLTVFYELAGTKNGKIDVTFLSWPSQNVIGRENWESLPPAGVNPHGEAKKRFTFPKILVSGEIVVFLVKGKTNCENPCSTYVAAYTYNP